MTQARKVFQEREAKVRRGKIRRFLDKHVYTPNPSLIVRDEGFTLPVEVSATLSWLRCREGQRNAAIAYARTPRQQSDSLLAFAAFLLLDAGRRVEARELAPLIGEEGFLGPFIRAEFATDGQERLRLHRKAQLRTVRYSQQEALRAQRRRFPALGER